MFGGGEDEAAADGIVGFLQDHIALCVGGAQDHAVGVAGQGWAVVEGKVLRRIEGQRGQAGGRDDLGVADLGEGCLCLGVVIARGVEACESKDGGAVGGVADAGEGERAVEGCLEPLGVKRAFAQEREEARGGDHRAHGVG